MSLHSKIIALSSFGVLFATTAYAQQAPAFVYYKGTHICHNRQFVDYWRIQSKDQTLIGQLVYHQLGSTYNEELILGTELSGASTLMMRDRDGRAKLAIMPSADGQSFSAQWLNYSGNPDNNCPSFNMTRTLDAKSSYEQLVQLMQTQDPDVDIARKVAEGQRYRPPLEFVNALDQTAISTKYKQASKDFWPKFYLAEQTRLTTMPIETEAQQKALIDEMRAATALDLNADGQISAYSYDDSYRFAISAINTVDDRLYNHGVTPQPIAFSSPTDICARFSLLGSASSDAWELVTGLSGEYWTRALAEDMLQQTESCKNSAPAQSLTRTWPEFEKRQQTAYWLRQQAAAMQQIPETLEAYRQSNWLQLTSDTRRQHDIEDSAYQRFFLNSVANKKSKMDATVDVRFGELFTDIPLEDMSDRDIIAKCDSLIDQKQYYQDPAADIRNRCYVTGKTRAVKMVADKYKSVLKAIGESPRDLALLTANGWLDAKLIARPVDIDEQTTQEFQSQIANVQAEAIKNSIEPLNKAFDKADPQKSDNAVVTMCENINRLSLNVAAPLVKVCKERMPEFRQKQKAARCDAAVKASGASNSLADSSIYADAEAQGKGIKVRDFICKMADDKTDITFTSTGMLWWSKQYMEVVPSDPRAREFGSVKARLESAGDGYTLVDIVGTGMMEGIQSKHLLGGGMLFMFAR